KSVGRPRQLSTHSIHSDIPLLRTPSLERRIEESTTPLPTRVLPIPDDQHDAVVSAITTPTTIPDTDEYADWTHIPRIDTAHTPSDSIDRRRSNWIRFAGDHPH